MGVGGTQVPPCTCSRLEKERVVAVLLSRGKLPMDRACCAQGRLVQQGSYVEYADKEATEAKRHDNLLPVNLLLRRLVVRHR